MASATFALHTLFVKECNSVGAHCLWLNGDVISSEVKFVLEVTTQCYGSMIMRMAPTAKLT